VRPRRCPVGSDLVVEHLGGRPTSSGLTELINVRPLVLQHDHGGGDHVGHTVLGERPAAWAMACELVAS
jgi:hypothetical protein